MIFSQTVQCQKPFPALFFILFFLTLGACKKEDKLAPIVFDSPYSISGSAPVGNIRVFTRAGEITSSGLLSYYTAIAGGSFDGLINSVLTGHQGIDTIRFTNQQASAYFNFSTKNYTVNNTGKRLKLIAQDTTIGFASFDPYSKTIPYFISLLKPGVYAEDIYSSNPSYIFRYKEIQKLIVNPQSSQLEIPYLTAGWFRHQLPAPGQYYYKTYNSLDLNFYKNLAAGDTVVVQESSIIYRR